MPQLPQKDEITIRWLIDRVPVRWWLAVIATLMTVFSAGVGAGRLSFQKLDGDISSKIATLDKLQSEVQNLTIERSQLQAEVVRLQLENEIQQMSPNQVRDALKEWIQD